METCIICGRPINENSLYFYADEGKTCSFECNKKYFWLSIIEDTSNRHVIYNGNCYWIGPERDKEKGFGGRRFHIEYLNGNHFYTTNLNYNGEVPSEFRAQLPDNVKIIMFE